MRSQRKGLQTLTKVAEYHRNHWPTIDRNTQIDENNFSKLAWSYNGGYTILAQSFSLDPIFGVDTGRIGEPGVEGVDPQESLTYNDGTLRYELCKEKWWPARDIRCFYREDDIIHQAEVHTNPTPIEQDGLRKQITNIPNLPSPVSGSYTIDWGDGRQISTSISSPTTPQPQWPRYDLQGRPIGQPQPRQIYIENGKKRVGRE